MTVNSLAGVPLKHYAQDKKTNARYVKMCYANDTDPDTCSVVDIDELDSDMRAELTNYINGDECQKVLDTWTVLNKKFFMNYPKATVLKVLQSLRKIKVVPSDRVTVFCKNNLQASPKEIVSYIKLYEKKEKPETLSSVLSPEEKKETPVETVSEPVNNEVAQTTNNDIKEIKESLASLTSAITTLVTLLQPKEEKKTSKK